MKVFIEDLVKKNDVNLIEEELPDNCSVRFEGDTANFSITMNGLGQLEIYKICKNSFDDSDSITVQAPSSNKFLLV